MSNMWYGANVILSCSDPSNKVKNALSEETGVDVRQVRF